MTVKNIQCVGDDDGLLLPAELGLRFRAPLTVTHVPEAESPGMVGNAQSVRGYHEIGLTATESLASYFDPTLVGLDVGRFDLDELGGISGAFSVKNGDGADYSFVVDNGGNLTSSAWTVQVGGTIGASLNAKSLDLPTWSAAITNPASGFARLRWDGTSLHVKNSSGNGIPLAATSGGTGQTTFTVGDILYASTTTAISKLAASTSGYVLTSNGAGVAPSWQATSGGGLPVHGTVTSLGDGLGGIGIDSGSVGIDAVEIIADPDSRSPNVVQVDWTTPFANANYAVFIIAYSVTGSAYATYWGVPTKAGRTTDRCVFRLTGSGEGDPDADPLSIMIMAV